MTSRVSLQSLGLEMEQVVFQYPPGASSFLRDHWCWERLGVPDMPQRSSDLRRFSGESIPGPKCSLMLSASCPLPISRPCSITRTRFIYIKPSPAECPCVHCVNPVSKEWDPEPVTQGLVGMDHGITKMTTITRGLSLQNVTKS